MAERGFVTDRSDRSAKVRIRMADPNKLNG